VSRDNYLLSIATAIREAVPSDKLPEAETETEELFLFYAVLALAKGERVEAEDVHNAWAAWMTLKDPTHESIKPYSELSAEVQRDDRPFLAAIREVASRHLAGD
jgi:hypothetical protein